MKTNHSLFIYSYHFSNEAEFMQSGKIKKKGDSEKSQGKSVKIRQHQGNFFLICRNLYFSNKSEVYFLRYFVLNFDTFIQ